MSPIHPYRSLQVPSDAPFKLKPSPGKGWGAFATKQIERGAMILREKPLFVMQKPPQKITEEDVQTAIQQLAPADKQRFLYFFLNASRPFISLLDAMAENSFEIYPEGSILPSYGVFLLSSRFNHSCIPNSKIPSASVETEETLAIFAARDITAGEEITFCYSSDLQCRIRHERHRRLRFICDCQACLVGTSFQQASDMRRTLVRGLQYLTLGKDVDGPRQSSALQIIVDPKLKKAAEEFSISLSSRLIYYLLMMFLLEEEGLMDEFRIEIMLPRIQKTLSWFETESNVAIAKLAMAQGTWFEKFCVAARLHGRRDAADHEVAITLRDLALNQ
ncbi:SET domain-containing protein [Trichoderma evansii]